MRSSSGATDEQKQPGIAGLFYLYGGLGLVRVLRCRDIQRPGTLIQIIFISSARQRVAVVPTRIGAGIDFSLTILYMVDAAKAELLKLAKTAVMNDVVSPIGTDWDIME